MYTRISDGISFLKKIDQLIEAFALIQDKLSIENVDKIVEVVYKKISNPHFDSFYVVPSINAFAVMKGKLSFLHLIKLLVSVINKYQEVSAINVIQSMIREKNEQKEESKLQILSEAALDELTKSRFEKSSSRAMKAVTKNDLFKDLGLPSESNDKTIDGAWKIILKCKNQETSFIIIISEDSLYCLQNKKLEKLEFKKKLFNESEVEKSGSNDTPTKRLDDYKKLLKFYIKKKDLNLAKDFNRIDDITNLKEEDIKTYKEIEAFIKEYPKEYNEILTILNKYSSAYGSLYLELNEIQSILKLSLENLNSELRTVLDIYIEMAIRDLELEIVRIDRESNLTNPQNSNDKSSSLVDAKTETETETQNLANPNTEQVFDDISESVRKRVCT